MKYPESLFADYLAGNSHLYSPDPAALAFLEKNGINPSQNSADLPLDFLKQDYNFSKKIVDVCLAWPKKNLLKDESISLNGEDTLSLLNLIDSFLEQEVLKGGRVAIVFPPSAMQALSILATIYSGRVPVIYNHWTKKEDLKRLCKERNVHGLICASEMGPEVMDIPVLEAMPEGELKFKESKYSYIERPLPHPDTGIVLFTSGSMGEPKAVALGRKGLMYNIETLKKYFGLNSNTVSAITLPIFHTMALNTHFFPTFFSGGTSHFINTELSMGKIYRSIIECQGNFVALIGDMLKLCLQEKEKRKVTGGECVKHIQMSGGIVRVEHLHLAKKLFPEALIHKGFGLTELIRICMINNQDPKFFDETVGRILPGQEVIIKDELNKIVPSGVKGQIFVKGDNVMLGYEGVPLKDQPFDENGFLATGDYGILTEDKRLYFYGRIDGTFKSQGRRISTMEIEQVSLNYPSITSAFAVAVSCEIKGLRPLLFVETKGKNNYFSKEEKNQLESLLRDNLEAYKIPKDIVQSFSLPRLPNSKINKKAIFDLWENKQDLIPLEHAAMGLRFYGHQNTK